ncbi:MAG: PDZ domain-containing protein [Treponema sp.]|uniref:PDZ domain-containing protein n=1 Tax=Treponema sp. TaxID=166 RepID=UPI0025EC02E8|nr:PDZ domain-containing protein [Treponema sp.]MBQ8679337.1 PDZ domain-containing protein [Treponema sp.]MBQ8681269.1 PDZ domain-containing protein [Treponema sp.]
MKKIILVLISLYSLWAFMSCGSTDLFEDFYTEYIPNNALPPESLLQDDEDVQVFYSTDVWNDTYDMMSGKYYRLKGYAGFEYNSTYNKYDDDDIKDSAEELAEDNDAKVVIYGTTRDELDSGVTTSSGMTNTYYNSYTRTTTSYSTPSTRSYTLSKYSYFAYLLSPYVKSEIEQWRLGLQVVDLSNDDRKSLKRNTGVLVDVVFQKFPAFYADLMCGDVIIEINGKQIRDKDDFEKAEAQLKPDDSVTMKIIHEGTEKTVNMTAK